MYNNYIYITLQSKAFSNQKPRCLPAFREDRFSHAEAANVLWKTRSVKLRNGLGTNQETLEVNHYWFAGALENPRKVPFFLDNKVAGF